MIGEESENGHCRLVSCWTYNRAFLSSRTHIVVAVLNEECDALSAQALSSYFSNDSFLPLCNIA